MKWLCVLVTVVAGSIGDLKGEDVEWLLS